MLDQSKPGNDPKQQRSLHPATSALRRKHLYPAQSPLTKNDITDDIMQCSFSAFLNQAQTPGHFYHIACGASLSRRHQDTEKTSRPERRRPRRHQQLIAMTLRQLCETQRVKMRGQFLRLLDSNACLA
jgi:hypothetical protein